jgi:hypothetical protein
LNRPASRLQAGARRRRPEGCFAEIFRCFRAYFKVRDRMAREDPHLFGPDARSYYQETVAEHRRAVEIEAALTRVYGPSAPNETSWANRIWSENYPMFHSAAEKQNWVKNWSRFRKQKLS